MGKVFPIDGFIVRELMAAGWFPNRFNRDLHASYLPQCDGSGNKWGLIVVCRVVAFEYSFSFCHPPIANDHSCMLLIFYVI